MAFKGGRSVSGRDVRGRDREDRHKIEDAIPMVLLPATNRGRMRMAWDYFDAGHSLVTFQTDSIQNAWLKKAIKDGAFVADAATRALFQAGFVAKTMLAGGFYKKSIIAGGAAGDHTVTGIAPGDELVSVWMQHGVTAQLSDLTGEFSITAADTINNGGGTDTTGHQLLVDFLDLTA